MKYIYLIQSLDDGLYKVGISKNPQKRLDQLQTGNASKLKLIEVYQSEYANKIEVAIHNFHKGAKKEGEWFDFGVEVEAVFRGKCQILEENFKYLEKSNNAFI